MVALGVHAAEELSVVYRVAWNTLNSVKRMRNIIESFPDTNIMYLSVTAVAGHRDTAFVFVFTRLMLETTLTKLQLSAYILYEERKFFSFIKFFVRPL